MNTKPTVPETTESELIHEADELAEKGLFDQAKEKYENAIKVSPENSSYGIKYGNFLLERGENLKAYKVYENVAFHEPRNATAFSLMGLVLIHLGRIDEAEVSLQKAVELNPSDRNSLMLLSGLREEKGSWDGILKAVETLIMILNFVDQPQQLKEILKRVDSNLLALVKVNAFSAREDQNLRLANQLDELVLNLENIIARRILD